MRWSHKSGAMLNKPANYSEADRTFARATFCAAEKWSQEGARAHRFRAWEFQSGPEPATFGDRSPEFGPLTLPSAQKGGAALSRSRSGYFSTWLYFDLPDQNRNANYDWIWWVLYIAAKMPPAMTSIPLANANTTTHKVGMVVSLNISTRINRPPSDKT